MKRIFSACTTRVLLLAACTAGAAHIAHAATISKTSGATTPDATDFPAGFNTHPNQTGYGQTQPDRMFRETFRLECRKDQKVSQANFTISVKKLTQGANRGDNDALHFMEAGNSAYGIYLWKASDAPGTTKTFNFNLLNHTSWTTVGLVAINNSAAPSLLNDHSFSFAVQDDTSVLKAELTYECGQGGGKKGMTWGVYPDNGVTGMATVACQGQPIASGTNGCDAYNGDTPGTVALPVLCMKALALPNPNPNGDPTHWSGNVIATTPAVPANNFAKRTDVNAFCVKHFGPDWVVADFHAGQKQGWKFGAYGNVGQPGKQRFWVNITDQANANVWNQN